MPTWTDLAGKKELQFIPSHENISDVFDDHNLAALGDAFVNFVYSIALSKKLGKPVGRKVDSSTLASALRKADLRKFLPSRTDRHKQADAAESLIVYAWLTGKISLEETLHIMEREKTAEDAFNLLLGKAFESISQRHAT
ncbi:MAG: hypothetical protein NWE76_03720 [Candidatus Bathyarchaeota archaeon]|nr:hypothetical protein [Candidatus Bathyarchaeota archaeon]